MKKRTTLTLLCLLGMAGSLFAQELSIKVDERGKAGYVDASGAEVVACKYDAAYPFVNGFGKVMKGEKFGLVDKTGAEAVPVKYQEITYNDKYNLYVVKAGKKFGVLDGNAQELVKAQYTYISDFNCYGKALIASGGKTMNDAQAKKNYLFTAKYGVLNADGTIAIPAKYKGLYEFSQVINENSVGAGLQMQKRTYYFGDTLTTDCQYVGYDAKGWSTNNAGILDDKGNIVIKPNQAQYLFKPQGGMARFYTYSSKNPHFDIGYINLETQQQSVLLSVSGKTASYDLSTDFMDNIAAVAKDGVWNIVDRNSSIVKSGYKSLAKGTNSGIWCAITSAGKCDFFDKEGKPLLEGTEYTGVNFTKSTESLDAQYLAVAKDGKWGLIDRTNKVYIPFEYDYALASSYGWVPVKKDGKWGMKTVQNEVLVPTEYADITTPSVNNPSALYVQKADKLWYVYNIAKKRDMGRGYKAAGGFVDGIAWARTSDMNVPSNQVYQALSPKAEINADNFGYIIDDEGHELVKEPMPISNIASIRELILQKGKHPLTQNETKNLLLKLSVGQRHYLLNTKIEEENWDY